MKTKKRLLAFCGLIGVLLLSVSLCIGIMFAGTEPVLETSTQLDAEYEVGAEIEIPKGTITVGDQSQDAEIVIVFPSGKAFQTNATQLTEEGVYAVQYRANIAGKLYVVKKTFTAKATLYGHGSGTKIKYGTYVASEHNPKNYQPTGGEVTGLQVSLAGGDTFRYNKVIDLNTLTKNDQIIQFAVTPTEIGTAETTEVYMYLTDAYDPTNFITIKVRQPEPLGGYSAAYMSAAAPGQPLTGYLWYRGNVKYTGGNYGTITYMNFAGYFRDNNGTEDHWQVKKIQDSTIQFSMDYANRQLHQTIHNPDSNTLVCDFDNPEHFTSLWDGFTTGEVFVSLTCSASASFCITQIAGRDMVDMEFGERTKPTVLVNYGDYTEETIPHSVVGKPYPVFEATARSPYDGTLPVHTRVFANYGEENAYELLIKDGVFTPTELGDYSIVYEARDNYGQIGRKVVALTTEENPEEMVITRGDAVSTGIAGHVVSISNPLVDKSVGNWKVFATYQVGEEEPVVIPFDNQGGFFIPTKAGTYKVTLTAIDFIGRDKSLSYNVVVEAGTKPVFEKEPVLPIAFIAGCEYVLPKVSAYNYTDGSGDPVDVTIWAESKTSSSEVKGNRKYTPTASKNGEIVTIKYVAMLSSGGMEEIKKEIPVIVPMDEEDNLRLERFLIKEGEGITSIVPTEKYTTVSFADSESSVTWATPVLASGLNIEFSPADSRVAYSGISIKLVDSENPEQAIIVNYVRAEKGTAVYINRNFTDKYEAAQSFLNEEEKFLLSYVSGTKSIQFDPYNKEKVVVEKTMYDKPFTGFDSGKVYVTFYMDGVTRATKMNVISISAQQVNDAYMDRLGPRIAMTGSYGGTFNLGEKITLCPGIAVDAIDPSTKCFLTVTNPDGSYAITDDNIVLKNVVGEKEYVFTLAQNGKYRVSYESVDMFENKAVKFSYVISVADIEKPVITVHNKVAATGKVGQAIGIPKFSVEDNLSSVEEITCGVMIFNPGGNSHMIHLDENDGFVPTRAGKYVLRYFAFDAEGNYTVVDYVIMVTE